LLAVAPDVFANEIFAVKGGRAINLLVRDMPRLSVDTDVVYLPWQSPRDGAPQAIKEDWPPSLCVSHQWAADPPVSHQGSEELHVDRRERGKPGEVEVNVVFRGSVLSVERRPLSAKAAICSASSTTGPLST